jgi:hypothetical protein
MATAKIKYPDKLTGDATIDLEAIRNYQYYLASELNYLLNNLDDENIIKEDKDGD